MDQATSGLFSHVDGDFLLKKNWQPCSVITLLLYILQEDKAAIILQRFFLSVSAV